MRKTFLATLCMGLMLGGLGIGQARCDDAKPIATIAFSGYDNLMTDVACIGKLADNPDLDKMIEGMIAMQTQGKGLAGLDKKRPWGVIVLASDAPMPTGYGFIPVTKLEDLLGVLGGLGMTVSDAGDGASEIVGPNGQSLFVKQQGDWAYIWLSKDGFAGVAADPAKLLGDSAAKYNLCVRLLLKNVPPSLREMVMGLLQMGMQAGMEQMPDESDENYALRVKIAQDSIKQTSKVLTELDTITIGLSVDEKTGQAHLDMEQTAVAGTDSAKQMAAATAKGKTAFGGFYQTDAALTACAFSVIDKTQQEQVKNSFAMQRTMLESTIGEQELSEEDSAKAKKLVEDIMKIFEDTIATGKIDMGFAARIAPAKSTLIAGISVADGAAVDKIVRELAGIAKAEQPEAAKTLKLDAAEQDGVKFHTVTFPLPDDESIENRERLVGIIGEEVGLVLGVGPKQVYLGVGTDALDKLKQAITRSKAEADSEVTPLRMSIAATPVAKLVGDLAEDFTVKIAASSIASALETAGSDDHVTMVSEAIPNGVRYHLTLQKGILIRR